MLEAVDGAEPVKGETSRASEPLTLTIVLRRDDETGFERFVSSVADPTSPQFRRFLGAEEIARRFGPSSSAYDAVERYLEAHGFAVVERSANRLTLTVRGTRTAAEAAFGTPINDYRFGARVFYANESEPQLPAEVGRHVRAVLGLSNLVRAEPVVIKALKKLGCKGEAESAGYTQYIDPGKAYDACTDTAKACSAREKLEAADASQVIAVCDKFKQPQSASVTRAERRSFSVSGSPPLWKDVTGAGQKIGIVAFDTFDVADVADYLELFGMPSVLGNLSQVHVGGGATPGANQDEVLLDVDTVLMLAPGAEVVVYDAPFTGAGTFQRLFSRMVDDGITIISNSWSYCEDQTTLADVESIDAILATAAAAGISVFNASGDTGSTCLNGAANTIGVPAGSPHATAVGGTTLTTGPAATYLGESWWDGASGTPPTGQGGFGLSRFFARPSYQDALNPNPMRSVPDVAINADPFQGVIICQASSGGCPSGRLYGGTSVAAPTWAAAAALLNEAQGQNLGNLNPLLYPLANTNAFHSAASMGSDFAHVGLGSPNLNAIHLALTGGAPGPVSPAVSRVSLQDATISADGRSTATVVVRLRDAAGNTVRGKTVSLIPNAGSTAVVSPPSGVSSEANGAVVFTVTNSTIEDVVLTATDITDGVVLSETPSVSFVAPPATAGGIAADATIVPANGSTFATITVTLQDVNGNGAVGKEVTLGQGSGRSRVSGPTPTRTDANGQVRFQVTNLFAETVTYTAVDVTDGQLAVPGSVAVQFDGGMSQNCAAGEPVPADGYAVTSFATGFAYHPTSCAGTAGMAFDAAGNLYVINAFEGHIYRFGPSGGTANAGTRITAIPLPSFPIGLAFGRDGRRLYVSRHFGGAGGDIVEISPEDGHIVRTVASDLNCVVGLATDPISGDLFASQACSPPSGSDNITRVSNPESAVPTLSVYASPGYTSFLNFGYDGTLWTTALRFDLAELRRVKIAGTNAPNPGQITVLTRTTGILPSAPLLPAFDPADPDDPPFLFTTHGANNLDRLDLAPEPPALSPVATGGSSVGHLIAGPDGCAYATFGDRVVKIARSDGSCDFAPSSVHPALGLTPTAFVPDPEQGTSVTLAATFFNITPPEGSPVVFVVNGANRQFRLARTDASGNASFSYEGLFSGADQVVATAQLDGATYTSNPASVIWAPGQHVTFLTLNPSPIGATRGQTFIVAASLTDASIEPAVGVPGATIDFALGESGRCTAVTDTRGLASCELTVGEVGLIQLTASFAGTTDLTSAEASIGFTVFASEMVPCLGDCNGDGTVRVDELVTGVNLALGTLSRDRCPAFDGNADTNVTVDELITAVNHALAGCSAN